MRVRVRVDGRPVEVETGATLLDAARQAGIDIPTLCHLEGCEPYTACMVCVVRDEATGKVVPACSAPASDGMIIDASGPLVEASRRRNLELLLSEHVGNCEGPCRQSCPASADVPRMITHLSRGELREAALLIRRDLVLPRTLERICPAPCEMSCRRGLDDAPVNIRHLIGYAVEAAGKLPPPACAPDSGKRVAILGAGPAGLSAAWFLRQAGHTCTLYDDHPEPGGMLRYGMPVGRLPRDVLAEEIATIRDLGVEFRLGTRIGRDLAFSELRDEADAVVLAVGKILPEIPGTFGVEGDMNGIRIDRTTGRTSDPAVFAGGDAVRATRRAVNSIADGRTIAASVDRALGGTSVRHPRRRFNSTIGCPQQAEWPALVAGANPAGRTVPVGDGFSASEALREAGRCLHCECQKPDTCKLRDYADRYGASGQVFRDRVRPLVRKVAEHAELTFEPGKCIRCGICIRIAADAGEPLGLTWLDRGFEVEVGVPFGRTWNEALRTAARTCAEACPTAALSLKPQTGTSQSQGDAT